MSNIVVIGSINMDVVNHVQKHPLPGETIKGWGTSYYPGGKGANQAVAAARAGGKVTMIGAVGNDSFGRSLSAALQKEGINTNYILEKEGTSGLAFITVDSFGENSIILSEGANGKVGISDLQKLSSIMKSADMLLLQNEIPWETTTHVFEEAQNSDTRVFFNPAPAFKVPEDVLPLIDVLILNETEVQVITGNEIRDVSQARLAAEQLSNEGVKEVVITLGKKGALYMNREGDNLYTPAFTVETVDTTAAGDTFIGAYAVASTAGQSIKESLQFASAASALSVTRRGAQSSIPNREEIQHFLHNQLDN
ncbi:ribokinase [Bacillus songklensis]|uniref:Ribokinase n=1 Tax=Bacillus songklensis TaxID=1069116 RepID=A0ABV8B8Y5_9BACI